MTETVKLSHVYAVLEALDYPTTRAEAADRLDGYTLTYADGESDLGEIVSGTSADRYESADELESELYNVLPVEAVGEPGQSEGEG